MSLIHDLIKVTNAATRMIVTFLTVLSIKLLLDLDTNVLLRQRKNDNPMVLQVMSLKVMVVYLTCIHVIVLIAERVKSLVSWIALDRKQEW